MNKETGIIEIVIFKIKKNITEQVVINSAKQIDSILKNFDGFLSRKLAVSKDGVWSDIVYWSDLHSAEYASSEVLKNEVCQKYFNLIDEKSMQFHHLKPVIENE